MSDATKIMEKASLDLLTAFKEVEKVFTRIPIPEEIKESGIEDFVHEVEIFLELFEYGWKAYKFLFLKGVICFKQLFIRLHELLDDFKKIAMPESVRSLHQQTQNSKSVDINDILIVDNLNSIYKGSKYLVSAVYGLKKDGVDFEKSDYFTKIVENIKGYIKWWDEELVEITPTNDEIHEIERIKESFNTGDVKLANHEDMKTKLLKDDD